MEIIHAEYSVAMWRPCTIVSNMSYIEQFHRLTLSTDDSIGSN